MEPNTRTGIRLESNIRTGIPYKRCRGTLNVHYYCYNMNNETWECMETFLGL